MQNQVGFQPAYANEGKFEALEFAAGNFGLLESAFEYERDKQPPRVKMTVGGFNHGPIYTTFEYVNEPSVIRYTLDGSKPNMSSTLWDSSGTREPGQVFYVTSDHDVPLAGDRHAGQPVLRHQRDHDRQPVATTGRGLRGRPR